MNSNINDLSDAGQNNIESCLDNMSMNNSLVITNNSLVSSSFMNGFDMDISGLGEFREQIKY